MFIDLDNGTSFSLGLQAKIDTFFNVIFNSAVFCKSRLLISSHSKQKRPSSMISIIKISSLFLPHLGLDNTALLRVRPQAGDMGRSHQMVKTRWSLWLSFSDIKDHVASSFNFLMEKLEWRLMIAWWQDIPRCWCWSFEAHWVISIIL